MKKLIFFFVLFIGLAPMLLAQTTISQDERMQWWRDARFGMFIHWGLYAIPAGEWNGKEIPGVGEWIMSNAKIPAKEYEKLAGQFNPQQFNPRRWVQVAKNAGMKYITFTTKHMDGFAMFKSNASKYNVVDATPYGKDIVKALADECHKQGIKICFYYSQMLDLHEKDGLGNNWDFPKERNFQKYLDEKVKPQLNELLTQYGQVDMIWFDMDFGMNKEITAEQAQSLKDLVRKLQPKCIISGRLGGGIVTDYMSTGDNIVASNFDNGDWEVPATLNDTWGFKKNDHTWKSPGVLIRFLFDIAGKGGNYLLNVGPTADGIIPLESVDILSKVGEWLKVNGDCIYGTKANPFKLEFSWGNITQKPGKLYLGFFNWPDSKFSLVGLKNKVKKVYLLSDKTQKAIPYEETYNKKINHHSLTINLPAQSPDKVLPVVVVEITGEADIEKEISQQPDGKVFLPGFLAHALNSGKPAALDFTSRDGGAAWVDAAISLTWDMKVEKPGVYNIDIVTSQTGLKSNPQWQGGHVVKVKANGQEQQCIIANEREEIYTPTPFWKKIHSSCGKINFEKPGVYTLSLVPQKIMVKEIGLNFMNTIGFTFKEIILNPDK